MNVKQLIEKYENILKKSVPFTVVNIHGVLRDLKQLDEPQKVVVPQFVADLFEFAKLNDWDLEDVFEDVRNESRGAEISKWFYQKKNMDILARAWLDGYEVEKEKRYLVKVKGVNEECEYLVFGKLSNTWKFRSLRSLKELKKHHTRKELEEANFDWVFDCPGVEVEEAAE